MNYYPVVIFAHNSQVHIQKSVDSVVSAFAGHTEFYPHIYVLVNGSTDRTSEIVARLESQRDNVRLVELEIASKYNAWNHYAYQLATDAPVHIFMDADITMGDSAGPEMIMKLEKNPDAFAVAALPVGGRNASAYQSMMRKRPAIWGGLYGLRTTFLEALREKELRMPIGVLGGDGLLDWFMRDDLILRGPEGSPRTVLAEKATLVYPSLRWYVPADIKTYWGRRIKYNIRFYQSVLLRILIEAKGIEAMPEHIRDCYYLMDKVKRPKQKGLNHLFDKLAWRRMRKIRNMTV